MSDPFLGQVVLVGFNFAPRGWAFCEGQLLAISQNTALFSLLGTIYGGDGRTTFGLPDLRGRAAIGAGHGPGLSSRRQGAKGGNEFTTLTVANMPSHSHPHSHDVMASSQVSDIAGPGRAFLGKAPTGGQNSYHNGPGDRTMDPDMIGSGGTAAGGGQSFGNLSPYLAMYYTIALQGIFPSRS